MPEPERTHHRFIENMIMRLGPLDIPLWLRYLLTTLFVFTSLMVRVLLADYYAYPFLFFAPAIVVAALFFNRGTGIYATIVSALLAAIFIVPEVSYPNPNMPGVGDYLALGVFALMGILLAMVIEALRNSLDRQTFSLAAIQNSEAQHRAILDTAADAIIVTDINGIIISANRATEKIFGYQVNEMIGRNGTFLLSPEEAKAMAGFLRDYLRTGKKRIIGIGRETEGQRPDGTKIPLDLSVAEWQDSNGQRYFTSIIRDITDQKAEARRLAHYMKELEETNQKLDDFAYVVSHDLKEPVRAISHFAGFLLEDYSDKLEKDGQEKLRILMMTAARMQEMITSLLHYTLLSRDQISYEKLDVNDIIKDILELQSIQLKSEDVIVKVSDNLPVIFCNKPHLSEIFRNLITNGIKYNDSRPKILEIGMTTEHPAHPEKQVFFVKDNGIGIPPGKENEIFRMFKRLHGREEYGGGTGSGLAIIKRMIEQLNGEIWVEPNMAGGSTFFFYLGCR